MTAVTQNPLASGDPLADRRFGYAKAAAEEGDFRASAELLEQALERAPNWAAAWFALGEAREKLGDIDAAAEAFRAALGCDPADAQGATARLALIGRIDPPIALPSAYVAQLFDQYAPRFETHLTEALFYRAPALIADALAAAAPARRFARALDLGCGSGLMGEALRAQIDHLSGIDLSPAMIEKARERDAYDELVVGEAASFLKRQPVARFDLIVAADSLVYIGDLAPLFATAAAVVAAEGLIAFSVESCDDGFRLERTMRFVHARRYIETTACAAGLRPLLVRAASIRREAGADVPGLICVFER